MMPINTHLVEGGYNFLATLTPLKAWKYFKLLQNNQWMTHEELSIIRWRKLKKVLTYSYENIPFYKRIWSEAGVDPRSFSSEADMVYLPTVDKKILIKAQENDEFLFNDRKDIELVHTSGTTGPNFYVPFTLEDFQKKYANHLRQVYASGWRLGVKSASLYCSGHPQFQGKYTGREQKESFLNYRKIALQLAHRRLSLPPYYEKSSGNDHFCRDWYSALKSYKPVMFETMDFNLPVLMEYIEKEKLQTLDIPIIYLLGTITEEQRQRFGKFFSAEVFNRYSPHEMEGVAFSCHEHKGMHISIDAFHVEFIDDCNNRVGPEETGHVALTDLDNYAMPLIRYKIGDLGFYYEEPCGCGRGLPLMGGIAGRSQDLIHKKDGSTIAPYKINEIFQNDDSVFLFQVIQTPRDQFNVNIVPKSGAVDLDKLEIRTIASMRKLLGNNEDINLKFVDKIELEPNGKVCFTKRLSG